MSRKRLGDMLIEAKYITDSELQTVLSTKSPNDKLGKFLVDQGYITEQQLIEILEVQLNIPYINLLQYPIEPDAVKLVPRELAKRHVIMPLRMNNTKLIVAMADPMDYIATEELRVATGFQIVPVIATESALAQTIAKHFDIQDSLNEVMSDLSIRQSELEMRESQAAKGDLDEEELVVEDSAIVRLVNQIISNAVLQRASDIHFDPQEKELKIRYRVDGVLRTERTLPEYMQNIIIARIKIMGDLNITENRIPQDGRIRMNVGLKPIDLRLSTLPSVYGEKIVMRILDLNNALDSIDSIDFSEENKQSFMKMIERPNGIVLITGPTGSGKSATLYAALNHLNTEDVNIITVEDPVEYRLEGINQVQVNEDVGMSFANGMRSILRQDPDIVMIGEIRDTETAQIAIRASLTGHLALSTLHTNSAIAALTRLIDMGIEPFLVASSIVGIIGQRLVRRVCKECSSDVPLNVREKEIFERSNINADTIRRGVGCPSCNMTGYKGRMAIHEVLVMNEGIRELMMRLEGSNIITEYARKSGMHFLIDDGLMKAAAGLTTIEEVLRVSSID